MIKKLLLIALLIFSANSVCAKDTLILLSNFDNVGDRNQLLGIAKAYKGDPKVEEINTKEVSASTIRAKVTKTAIDNKVIVIGSGEGSMLSVQELTPQKNVVICLSSHVILDGYNNPSLMEKVDFLALPGHASKGVAEGWQKKLILTTGFSHNRQREDAQKAYNLGKDTLPACKSYLGIYLAGDAPTPSKEIKLFTKDEAEKLAVYIANQVDDSCILILNGPRTGKHDKDKQEIKTAHRDGKLDHVTAAFKVKLESKIGPEKVHIIDFQFNGPQLGYNTFDLVLGALLEKKGKIFVPGESTSVISEAIDVLGDPKKITIYKNGAMSEAHENHVMSEGNAGRASVLADTSGTPMTLSSTENKGPTKSSAQTIAEKLWLAVHQ
ncbi:MAG: hypothetical protein ACD_21C00279G0002 [uncultured bacterium]|nr:MAG: hypothetical protein ACD_21C00279G0002 [uncultured bacterium]OGT08443.1 MAG: hypothetical protein A2V89_02805 [Gammaproteobacteria bacterium RBG_16_37_9]